MWPARSRGDLPRSPAAVEGGSHERLGGGAGVVHAAEHDVPAGLEPEECEPAAGPPGRDEMVFAAVLGWRPVVGAYVHVADPRPVCGSDGLLQVALVDWAA